MEFQLRQSLFWDFDVKNIDLNQHEALIIERITSRGKFEEFKEMLLFYGYEKVKNILLNARYLDKKTLAFCCVKFQVPIDEFRCYKLAQLNPEHWNY